MGKVENKCSTSNGTEQAASSSSSQEGGVEIRLPWSRCLMGCTASEKAEVTLLPCLHVICSDKCSTKFMSEVKPGLPFECKLCHTFIPRDQMSTKIIPAVEFSKKTSLSEPELLCEHCVFDKPATAYCAECPVTLCLGCSELHPLTRATQRHTIQFDLTEVKSVKLEKKKAEATNCQTHELSLTHVCFTCTEKICRKCLLSTHKKHTTAIIAEEIKELTSTLDAARSVMDKCDRAVTEIKKKREEILSSEWHTVMAQINEQFAVMLSVLHKRQKELRREAKLRFLKQLNVLDSKIKCAELTKSSSKEFIETGEQVITNMEDVASVNYLRRSKGYQEWLTGMEKKLTQDFDRFTDKDWHFQVDSAANIQAQTYLKEYCQVEYSFQPRIKLSLPLHKTYTPAKKSVYAHKPVTKSDSEIIAAGSSNGYVTAEGASIRTALRPRSPARAGPPVITRTYSKKDRAAPSSSVSNSPSTPVDGSNSIGLEEAISSTKTVVPNPAFSEPDSSRTSRHQVHVTSPDDEEGEEDVRVEIEANGTINATKVKPSGSKTPKKTKPEADKKTTEERVKRPSSRAENKSDVSTSEIDSNDSEAGSDKTVELNEDTLESVDSSPENSRSRSRTSTRSRSISSARSPVTSPEVPASSEGVLGKRERKKKSFPPGFVGVDDFSWKIARLGLEYPEPATSSTTRDRRKSGSSKCGPPDAKMPRLMPEPEAESNGPVKVTNENAEAKHEVENGQDYESSDDYASEPGPSTRRQSLRRKTVQKPTNSDADPVPVDQQMVKIEPELPTLDTIDENEQVEMERLRPKSRCRKTEPSEHDDDNFEDAPQSSIENPPEFCDFPVQGQGIMKIKYEDQNDDYCCICLDGGEIIVCCDYCPKVFHLDCHIPVLPAVPEGDENDKWRCNYDTTKEMIDEIISKFPEDEGSENSELIETNRRHFTLACKFLMECYKIPEIPTVRWKFPQGYLNKHGKVPYHLKYIKDRLCIGVPEHFSSVRDMLLAFKQMFLQAFNYYKLDKHRPHAAACFEKFLALVDEYYPDYKDIFDNMLLE